jgi:AcrR family transcriptional regulator
MSQTSQIDKRRTLNARKISEAAIKLADGQGIEALSMRKLATNLGVTAMSIYNHVANKDDLISLMLDHVVTEFERPQTDGEWKEMMRRRAHSMRRAFLKHPWAPSLLISTITNGEQTMRDGDATLGCLINAGFTYAAADWARNAIDSHTFGYTMQEINFPVEPDEYRTAATHYLPMISKSDYPFLHGATTALINEEYDGVTQFDFGLELILDGLERQRNTAI